MKTVQMIVLALSLGLVGCGKESEEVATFDTPEGKVTVHSSDDGEVARIEVQGEEGKSSVSIGNKVTEAEIGIKFYPGAEQTNAGGFSMQTDVEEGEQATMAMLHTGDDIDKVAGFYKQEYADANLEVNAVDVPGHHMITLTIEQNERAITIMLMANAEKGGTDIQLMRAGE